MSFERLESQQTTGHSLVVPEQQEVYASNYTDRNLQPSAPKAEEITALPKHVVSLDAVLVVDV